jgi:hypothetical protein
MPDSPQDALIIQFSLQLPNPKAERALRRLIDRWKPSRFGQVTSERRQDWTISFSKLIVAEASAQADALFDEVGIGRLEVKSGKSRFVQEAVDAPGSFAAKLRRR